MSGVLPMSGPTAPSALAPHERELAAVARRWLASRSPSAVVRVALEATDEVLPPFWEELASMGWIGLAVPEQHGGQGGRFADLATVLEEWGRACAPGPLPGTAAAATLLGRRAPHLVGPMLAGEPAAVVLPATSTLSSTDRSRSDRSLLVSGTAGPIDGGAVATWFLAPVRTADEERWVLLHRDEVEVTALRSADPTRRLGRIDVDEVAVASRWTVEVASDEVDALVAALCAAEAVGVASWCVHTAAAYARDRVQFDRPIGAFQAVKHRCADALCRLEAARAATWDAAQLGPDDEQFPLAAAAAAALAPAAAFECAKFAIQVLGGVGYTWEHDAHLYLRRATAAHHLGGGPEPWRAQLVDLARSGRRRTLRVDLGTAADEVRPAIRAAIDEIRRADRADWNRLLADGGWLCPHWPEPWGRGASPIEQLVIDEELRAAGIRRPHLQVAAWVLPTLVAHGTREQQERFVPPSLRLELRWCQLFSEPGAGSDLASLATRAERVPGGWSLSGQKVWTTLAREADWGLCLARTDPAAPRHEGITCFAVDMTSPGIEIRPLRELTGMALFNEVFLDGVVVPDECVVGAVGDGWRCARTTLENERVSMATGSSFGPGVEAALATAESAGLLDDPRVADRLGDLLAVSQALAVLGLRTTLRALGDAGRDAQPGPEASVRKLLGVEHEQATQELGMSLLGHAAAVDEGEGARWFAGFIGNRALSIAGGTSEIQRNVIGERLLGLPRDRPDGD